MPKIKNIGSFEVYLLTICDSCGEPITELESAMVVFPKSGPIKGIYHKKCWPSDSNEAIDVQGKKMFRLPLMWVLKHRDSLSVDVRRRLQLAGVSRKMIIDYRESIEEWRRKS